MSGDRLVHMASPANQINRLMVDLLDWLNDSDVHPLIQSSVFHRGGSGNLNNTYK